jgi:hypothetical protein
MDKATVEDLQFCGIVPYLGIFLSDFTFLDEGSPTFLTPGASPLLSAMPAAQLSLASVECAHVCPGLVNLKKVKLFASAIKKIKEYFPAPARCRCTHVALAGSRLKCTRFTLCRSSGRAL